MVTPLRHLVSLATNDGLDMVTERDLRKNRQILHTYKALSVEFVAELGCGCEVDVTCTSL